MDTLWSSFLNLQASSPEHTPLGFYHILPSNNNSVLNVSTNLTGSPRRAKPGRAYSWLPGSSLPRDLRNAG